MGAAAKIPEITCFSRIFFFSFFPFFPFSFFSFCFFPFLLPPQSAARGESSPLPPWYATDIIVSIQQRTWKRTNVPEIEVSLQAKCWTGRGTSGRRVDLPECCWRFEIRAHSRNTTTPCMEAVSDPPSSFHTLDIPSREEIALSIPTLWHTCSIHVGRFRLIPESNITAMHTPFITYFFHLRRKELTVGGVNCIISITARAGCLIEGKVSCKVCVERTMKWYII